MSWRYHDNSEYEGRSIFYSAAEIALTCGNCIHNEEDTKINLMDKQKHSIATIKSTYNDRWNGEELFKFVNIPAVFFALQKNRQHLSLNSIEESQEENVLKSIYSNVIISLISYLFTTLNEKPETASKKILRYFLQSKKTGSIKSLLLSGIFEVFLGWALFSWWSECTLIYF